jgi:hypothetical protein
MIKVIGKSLNGALAKIKIETLPCEVKRNGSVTKLKSIRFTHPKVANDLIKPYKGIKNYVSDIVRHPGTPITGHFGISKKF